MLYIKDLAESIGSSESISSDKPIWLKGIEIVSSKKLNAVVLLGVFHCLMSFVGSAGASMEVSELGKPLQQVHGTNTVSHMMSRKATLKSTSRTLPNRFCFACDTVRSTDVPK